MGKKIEIPLVGMRHRVTPTTIRELAELTPITATLKREPSNLHDDNAVAVYLTEKPFKDFQVGYVMREVAAEIAPLMDKGKFQLTEAWVTEIDAEHGSGNMMVKYNKR